MAAYGASRGELNGDGNQDSATDDYLATLDQRFPSVSSQGIEEKIILLCTMEIPAYVLLSYCAAGFNLNNQHLPVVACICIHRYQCTDCYYNKKVGTQAELMKGELLKMVIRSNDYLMIF